MFNWGIVVWAVLLISCKNTGATTSDGATDSTQVTSVEQILKLPALKPGEEIVFEDDKVRIVEGGIVNTDGGMYNTLNMQPKNASYKQFKIEGTVLAFENVVGNAILASEGTGTIRMLWVYDLTTGEKLLGVESFADYGIVIENDHQFSFYRYDDALPQVSWNEEKAVWENRNHVPSELQNADLEEAKKKSREYLFNGLTLMAHQKVQVDIQVRKATPQNEYKWEYIE